MPYPSKFTQYPKLPREVRDAIWTRSLPSGPRIDFKTIRQNPAPDARGDWSTLVTFSLYPSLRPLGVTQRVDDYLSAMLSMVPSPVDGRGGWGKYSARTQAQEVAATCSDAHRVVVGAIRGRAADSKHPKPLLVFAAQEEQPYTHLNLRRRDTADGNFWNLKDAPAAAFLWQPSNLNTLKLQMLLVCEVARHVKTLYLVDLTRPLRLTLKEFRGFNIRAGPWYGNQYVFVDLHENATDDLDEYLSGHDNESGIIGDYEYMKWALRSDDLLDSSRTAAVPKLRVLTPVWLSLNPPI
ncbi:hypothetical protein C8A00DRAFT_36941 [Chaetomidium leptoderma]|uniref:2EXR domain-containing protein n=1 Tax=Chaetomidium leptoderma TaxID=669021 RepID=A0AAN6ZU81_9PEZI|nr:hypothetical protein C8A00DRAFT_36941 [Chaetomidium leptoderma]